MAWVKVARPAQEHNPPVYQIILIQAAVAVLMGFIGYWHSVEVARSLVVGALICTAGHAVALAVYFTGRRPDKPREILRSAYLSEALKLALTIGLFVVAFSATRSWQPLPLFGGYVVAQLVYWATPLFWGRHSRR